MELVHQEEPYQRECKENRKHEDNIPILYLAHNQNERYNITIENVQR